MRNAQKGPLCNLRTTQADQGLRCPLTESVDTVVYADEQKMPRLDRTDAHAGFVCKMYKGPFRVLRIICFRGENTFLMKRKLIWLLLPLHHEYNVISYNLYCYKLGHIILHWGNFLHCIYDIHVFYLECPIALGISQNKAPFFYNVDIFLSP